MFSGYIATVLITIGIYILLAISLNIITGYAGQISLGHAAFFGIGAYSAALICTKANLSFWSALVLAVIITAIIGAILAIPCLRVQEDFLAITTMGINFVVQAIFQYVEFFGGAMGIGGIPSPSFFGYSFSKSVFLWMVITFILLVFILDQWLIRSWLGLALESVREDELAASVMGVNIPKFKVIAFTIGTGIAGLAGAIYASFMSFISAGDFAFSVSIVILSMVVLGGIGTIRGAIVGAIILGAAPELFRPIMEYRTLIYGLLLVMMMRFQPSGLLGKESFLWRQILKLSNYSGRVIFDIRETVMLFSWK
jgi:branched-chain amino acid transport system permease protein